MSEIEDDDENWALIEAMREGHRDAMREIATIRPTSTPDAVVRPVRSDDDAKAVEGE